MGVFPKGRDSCSGGEDRRYTEVYSRSEMDILTPAKVSNGGNIPNNYVDHTDPKYDFFLVSRPEVQWNTGCPSDRTKVAKSEGDVEKLLDAQTAFLSFTVITFITIVLVGGIILLLYKGQDDDGKIEEGEAGYKMQQKIKIGRLILKGTVYICVIVSLVYAISMKNTFAEISDTTNADTACTDNLTVEQLFDLSILIDNIAMKDLMATGLKSFDLLFEAIETFVLAAVLAIF